MGGWAGSQGNSNENLGQNQNRQRQGSEKSFGSNSNSSPSLGGTPRGGPLGGGGGGGGEQPRGKSTGPALSALMKIGGASKGKGPGAMAGLMGASNSNLKADPGSIGSLMGKVAAPSPKAAVGAAAALSAAPPADPRGGAGAFAGAAAARKVLVPERASVTIACEPVPKQGKKVSVPPIQEDAGGCGGGGGGGGGGGDGMDGLASPPSLMPSPVFSGSEGRAGPPPTLEVPAVAMDDPGDESGPGPSGPTPEPSPSVGPWGVTLPRIETAAVDSDSAQHADATLSVESTGDDSAGGTTLPLITGATNLNPGDL